MNRSGLIALSDGVRAFFQANSVSASVPPVGWRYRSFQVNQGPGGGSRVCFIPGKIDPTAPGVPKVLDAGQITQPRQAGASGPKVGGPGVYAGNPRPLRWWHKVVTVSIWGVDISDPSNDELQLAATEDLFEATIQAMHHAVDPVSGSAVGLADIEITDAQWVLPPVEMAFGRELVLFIVQNGPLFDLPVETTTPQPAIIRGAVT